MIALAAWLTAAALLLTLARIARDDARRFVVDVRVILALVLTGLAWRLAQGLQSGEAVLTAGYWIPSLLGGGLGLAAVLAPNALAWRLGRNRPLHDGDTLLLGALGLVLGPLGLAWTLLAGSLCALLHRICLQRRRRRPLTRGLTPLGPGLAAGAALVIAVLHVSPALAGGDDSTSAAPLAATELPAPATTTPRLKASELPAKAPPRDAGRAPETEPPPQARRKKNSPPSVTAAPLSPPGPSSGTATRQAGKGKMAGAGKAGKTGKETTAAVERESGERAGKGKAKSVNRHAKLTHFGGL